jgi:predicted Zn-dependent peptidase
MSRIQKSLLHSGIRVITEEMPDVESSTIGLWVRTGSRDETPEVGGISHFIEHLLFKGTRKRTALDIAREIESVGGVLNAFTGREYTCFYAKVLNKDLPLAIDILSDIFINSRFDAVELEKERMVILQEIKMLEDSPEDLVHDLFADRFWKGYSLGRPVSGNAETIKSLNREDVSGYFKRRYRPGSVFITAAGGLKHGAVMRTLKKTFGRLRGSGAEESGTPPVHTPGARLFKRDLEQVHICLGVPAFALTHPHRYRLYLLSTILGGGMSSRLFQEIREKRGLVYSVYSYLSLFRDAGSLVVYAGTSREEVGKVVRLLLKEFKKLHKGVDRVELRGAKEQLKGGMLLGLETSDSRMTKLAKDEMYFKRVVPVGEIVEAIDRVKGRDIKETAMRLLAPGKITVAAVGNVGKRDLPLSFKKIEIH